ncbi:uncharacterized protein METZ01_LOCUS241525 [marine metagenome]|uniref:Carrier domain-containing protein n=1 Tax=marine metagenome TaxID=408172 RepID=A0A382HQ99_9ZZZZ
MGSGEFNFTDKEFIDVLNVVCAMDMGPGEEYTPITTMDEQLNIQRFDSMGILLFFIWVAELFGISESKIEEFMTKKTFTIRAVADFVKAEATRSYSYAQAEEYAKRCF